MASDKGSSTPAEKKAHHFHAGDAVQHGNVTTVFLAPTPLPTQAGVGDANEMLRGIETEATLEFNGPKTTAFQWGIWLNIMWVCAGIGLGIPYISYLLVGGFWESVAYLFWPTALVFAIGAFSFFPDKTEWGMKRALNKLMPIVFNRQKRQVWVTMEDGTAQCFNWELMGFAISEARGATQYGVHSQTSVMLVFELPGDDCTTVEYMARHPLTALSSWETLRAWMEYEIDEVRTLDPHYTPGDPPWEGRHTFRRKRQELHQKYRDSTLHLGWLIGWYAWRIIFCGWDLNYRWAEIDGRRFERVRAQGHGRWSKELLEWCKPIPEEEWARPSSLHQELSRRVRLRSDKQHTAIQKIANLFLDVRLDLKKELTEKYGEGFEAFDPKNHEWNTEEDPYFNRRQHS